MIRPDPTDREPPERWAVLAVLSVGILLAMGPWFSAAAVAPFLRAEWGIAGLGVTLLSVTVQVGFAAGALAIAASGAADVVSSRVLFAAGAFGAAIANLAFALLAHDPAVAALFRFLTGVSLAATYPIGMKVLAGWFRRERGLAIGVLVGGITVGSASPHLLRAAGAIAGADWRSIVIVASAGAAAGGLLVLAGTRRGPFEVPEPAFSLRLAARAWRDPAVRLANIGYLGHMWELFAMWTWIPAFLVASFAAGGLDDPVAAGFAAFVVVAAGGVGSIVAGALADRLGRTTLTMAAMAASGTTALVMGFAFGGPPALVLVVGVAWGLTIVADSAQFSTAVSELAPAGTAGSALSLQVALGFVLTSATILFIGAFDPADATGWRLAFATLALGPAIGILAMWRLRGRPEAMLMANGNR